jgi:hypothetical protein
MFKRTKVEDQPDISPEKTATEEGSVKQEHEGDLIWSQEQRQIEKMEEKIKLKQLNNWI